MPFDDAQEDNGGGGGPDKQEVLNACLGAILQISRGSGLDDAELPDMMANVGIHVLAMAAVTKSTCGHRECFEADLWEMLGNSHGFIIEQANRDWDKLYG